MHTYRPASTAHTISLSIPRIDRQSRPFPSGQYGPESFDETKELVEDLAQAYEINLNALHSLRPLVPELIQQEIDRLIERNLSDLPYRELDASIVFIDIENSTALMKAHSVRHVVAALNTCAAMIIPIVQRNGGEVHKFLGDGYMVQFRSPADAVRAGREIQRAVAELNAHRREQGLWCFETRLAIDTGTVVLASIGTSDRYDYSLFGHPVNHAAHLSERATPGTVWISQHTYDQLPPDLACRAAPIGRTQETSSTVYEIACT
jgi:class 3 adenylate cyclase